MLPEIGATELLVIAAVALIVVGPKDLPMLLRKLGSFVARLRGMASEFRTSFDDMARQSELDDLRREVAAMRDTAAAESSAVQSSIADLNSDALTSPAYEGSVDYDPEWALKQEQAEAAAAAPTETPKPKAAPKSKAPPKPKAAPKAAAPKLTVSKVEPPTAPKPPKSRAPRKAST